MQKKNSKLESFLYRSLSEDKYERIRGYESCIVVSERENKAFKYVVLGDEWIYLTENPPKVIQETVGLGDIVSVELVSRPCAFTVWPMALFTNLYVHVCSRKVSTLSKHPVAEYSKTSLKRTENDRWCKGFNELGWLLIQ